MKKYMKLFLTMFLFFISLSILFQETVMADEYYNLKVNLSGPEDLIKNIKVEIEGKDPLKEGVKLPKGSNYKLIIKNIPEDTFLFEFNENRTQFYYNLNLVDITEDKEINLEIAEVGEKLFADAIAYGDKEITVYGIPNMEFKYGFSQGQAQWIDILKDGKIGKDGKTVIKFDEEENGLAFNTFYIENNRLKWNMRYMDLKLYNSYLEMEEIHIGDTEIKGITNYDKNVDIVVLNYKTGSQKFYLNINTNSQTGEFIQKIDAIKENDIVLVNTRDMNIAGNRSRTMEIRPLLENNRVKRLSGKNRYETSLEIAKYTYPKVDNIVILNGDKSADSLSAGPIANELNAPILLTTKDFLYYEAEEYIKESGAKNIIVVGGENAISKKLIDGINELGISKIKRLSGINRYETSFSIAKYLMDNFNYNKSILIANGLLEADALSVSSYATESKQPILLTDGNHISKNIVNEMKNYKIGYTTIIGGENTIKNTVFEGTDLELHERIAGSNRYETSVKIAEKLENVDSIVFTNGYKSVDALSAASLYNVAKAPILLTDGVNLTKTQEEFIIELNKEKNIEKLYVVGGRDSIEDIIINKINILLNN